MRILPLLALSSLLLTACEREADAPQPAPETTAESSYDTPFPRSELECSAAGAKKARAWISAWHNWRGEGPDTDGIDVPVLDTARLDEEPRFTIRVESSRLTTRGQESTLDELAGRITEVEKRRVREAKLLGRPPESLPMTIGLAAAPDVSGERLLDVLRHLRITDETQVLFLFEAPPLPEQVEPVPEELLTRLRELFPPMERQREIEFDELTKATDAATAGCDAYSEFFHQLQVARPERRMDVVREALIDAWRACDCEGDLAFLVARFAVVGTGLGTPVTVLELNPDPGGTPLGLKPNASWSDTAPGLLEHAGRSACVEATPVEGTVNRLICSGD